MSNAYEHYNMAFTNYTPGFRGVIDYIFYSDQMLEVLDVLKQVPESYYKDYVGFPNAHIPSESVVLI